MSNIEQQEKPNNNAGETPEDKVREVLKSLSVQEKATKISEIIREAMKEIDEWGKEEIEKYKKEFRKEMEKLEVAFNDIEKKREIRQKEYEKTQEVLTQKLEELAKMEAVLLKAKGDCTKESLDEIIAEYDKLMAVYKEKWSDE